MLDFDPFALHHPDYAVIRLTWTDRDRLQALFERCRDFFALTTGQPPEPTAAASEFTDVPDGKTPADLCFLGLHHRSGCLRGAIIAVQDYPEATTWWLSLMVIDPADRGRGLGSAFYRAFERWLAGQGVTMVALCAIAPNHSGRRFWQRMGFVAIRKTPPRSYGQKTHAVYVYRRCLNPMTPSSRMAQQA